MNLESLKNKRVLIKTISELGTVVSYHYDERDEPIVVVTRDSDGQRHCCRVFEIEVQLDNSTLFQQYVEVLAALETIVPVMQNVMLHQGKYMTPADRVARNSVLNFCEETLNKYRVESVSPEDELAGTTGE